MSSHYYHPTTGELLDGLREARKLGGLPSPTTVLGLIKGPGLIKYLQRQAWEGGVTTPRLPNEPDDAYFDRCMHAADEHSKNARERGGDFHTLCQRFHLSCMGEETFGMYPTPFEAQFDAYMKWYETYVQKTVACEQFVLGQGYAGRMDHLAQLKDGRLAVVDVKTQDLKGKSRFNYYSEWALQLGAYAGATNSVCPDAVDTLVSVVVSANTTTPIVIEAYYWPKPIAYYHKLFLGLLAIWNEQNKYWPQPTPIDLPA